MAGAAGDVEFDWTGSLAVARRLWALAARLETVMSDRVEAAEFALTDWQGPHATSFASRIGVEQGDVAVAAPQLRDAARAWAGQWKEAMDQQNNILRTREWEGRDDSTLHTVTFGVLGSGKKQPPDPVPAAVPEEPEFGSTRGFYPYFSEEFD